MTKRTYCENLAQIIDLLLANGNHGEWEWGVGGGIYKLEKPIDFELIVSNLDLVEYIRLNKDTDSIFDYSAWDEIQGANYKKLVKKVKPKVISESEKKIMEDKIRAWSRGEVYLPRKKG